MKTVLDIDGSIIYSDQQYVFEHSNLVDFVELYSPFEPFCTILINFERADGVRPKSRYMAYTGQKTHDGKNYYVYSYFLTGYQLMVPGELRISFSIKFDGTEANLNTALVFTEVKYSYPDIEQGYTDAGTLEDAIALINSQKANRLINAETGNIIVATSGGDIADSGKLLADFDILQPLVEIVNNGTPIKLETNTKYFISTDKNITFIPQPPARGDIDNSILVYLNATAPVNIITDAAVTMYKTDITFPLEPGVYDLIWTCNPFDLNWTFGILRRE